MSDIADLHKLQRPYPGLRPFDIAETDLFFGRGEQIDEMLARLEQHRFLAVVGASGSGKSSLVRAGLLPALTDGLLFDAGPDWTFVIARPGSHPIRNLARSLLRIRERVPDDELRPLDVSLVEATLCSGPKGLIHAIADLHLPEQMNVLVLVDQFEELFRFRYRGKTRQAGHQKVDVGNHDEAAQFVDLLLNTAENRDVPVYVTLTMRSDFLGDCDAFHGLPGAINDSQFLTPRLTRDQMRDAIVGPARFFNDDVEEPLVNRILNDVGDDPDQLPLMQHALMRVWTIAASPLATSETMRLADYESEAVGGLEGALSNHADEIYNGLHDDVQRRVCKVMFRSLSDRGAEHRLTRRLVTVGEVAATAGVELAIVIDVANRFRQCNFLMPPPDVRLTADSTLDISHESLIRQWERLQEWLVEEDEWAKIYVRLSETARSHYEDEKAGLYYPPELDIALQWRKDAQPTAAWASRYNDGFEQSMKFLDESAWARRIRVAMTATAVITVMVLGVIALILSRRAESARADAVNAKKQAVSAKQKTDEILNVTRVSQAYKALQLADLRGARENLAKVKGADGSTIRGWDWQYIDRLTNIALWTAKSGLDDEDASYEQIYHGRELAFRDDGSTLLFTSRNGELDMLDCKLGEQRLRQEFTSERLTAAVLDRQGERLAFVNTDGEVHIRRIRAGEVQDETVCERLTGDQGSITQLDFGPKGEQLVAAYRFEDPGATTDPSMSKMNQFSKSPNFDFPGKTFGRDIEHSLVFWDSRSGDRLASIKNASGAITSMAVSPNGRWVAVATTDAAQIAIFDLAEGKELAAMPIDMAIGCLSFHPGGRWLFAGNRVGDLMICRLSINGTFESFALEEEGSRNFAAVSNARTHNLFARPLTSLACSPDGSGLVCGSEKGQLVFLDLAPMFRAPSIRGFDDRSFQSRAVLTPPMSNDYIGYLPRELSRIFAHEDAVKEIAFHPTGNVIASRDAKREISVWQNWRVSASQFVMPMSDRWKNYAVDPFGRFVAVGRDGQIELWAIECGAKIGDLQIGAEENQPVAGEETDVSSDGESSPVAVGTSPSLVRESSRYIDLLQFSPDGKWLAAHRSGDGHDEVCIWNTTSWQLFRTKIGESTRRCSGDELQFSPDSQLLHMMQKEEQQVSIWPLGESDPSRPEEVRIPDLRADSKCLVLSNSRIVVDADDGLVIANLKPYRRTAILVDETTRFPVRLAAHSRSSRFFAAYPDRVYSWFESDPKVDATYRHYGTSITDIAIGPYGRRLFLMTEQGIQMLDVETSVSLCSFEPHYDGDAQQIYAPLRMADQSECLAARAMDTRDEQLRLHLWEVYGGTDAAKERPTIAEAIRIGGMLNEMVFPNSVLRELVPATDKDADDEKSFWGLAEETSDSGTYSARRLLRGCHFDSREEKERQVVILEQLLTLPDLPTPTYELALNRARVLTEKFPDDEKCNLVLGIALLRMQRYEDAAAKLAPLAQDAVGEIAFTASKCLVIAHAHLGQLAEAWNLEQSSSNAVPRGIRAVGYAEEAKRLVGVEFEFENMEQEVIDGDRHFSFEVIVACPTSEIAERIKAVADVGDQNLGPAKTALQGKMFVARWDDAKVPAQPPYNEVRVVVSTREGNMAIADGSYRFRQIHYLIMGVETFRFRSPLRGAVNDARAIAAAFSAETSTIYRSDGGPRPLIDGELTKAAFEQRVAELRANLRAASEDDLLVVHYSGVELSSNDDFYLVPADGNMQAPESLISWSKDLRPLMDLPCRVLFLIDTCNAGKVVDLERAETSNNRDRNPRNVYVITACQDGELAYESDGMGNFSRAIVEVLDGRAIGEQAADRNTSYFKDLVEHVRNELEPRKQNPAVWPSETEQRAPLPLTNWPPAAPDR